ncbi:AIPR family protein [Bifidobacterium criceti]|uniref:Abortive phage infection n=1 Tax=Bifidobacterium criceti TaxID=1960969 RepID=A0A2A2EH01_9BIFI|nr:AIPR family protein [Bifidobacterium criceti]PAU68281.1 abortive phage infection [Bifidobacterium criceti]
MESLEEYHHDLVEQVQNYAAEEELLDQEAFFNVACELLRNNDVIAEYAPAPYFFHGQGSSNFMMVDGYDFSSYDQDESIVIIGCDNDYSIHQNKELPTIQTLEYKRSLQGMRNFVISALKGTFLEQAEESSEVYGLAQFMHEHKDSIRRVRLYYITDREFTGRDAGIQPVQDIYSPTKKEGGIGIEAHLWDLARLRDAAEITGSSENLVVHLDNPGVPAVHAPVVDTSMKTYLLFLTGDVLAKLYQEYGSKLMESNVRSFLSMRGKINKGIRNTILEAPNRFVAYNNGLTATASNVEFNTLGNITSITDLQIVNGGQTTASIYYTGNTSSNAELEKVVIPVKLVVVDPTESRNLIPDISRFTNSQNKVAEADFSANSEFQVKLEQISRTVLTPLVAGKRQTRWYYERVRGQYDVEKSRLQGAQRKQFTEANPTRQRIKMVDAAKYLMCWQGFPEIASLGSQKCFAKFAIETNDKKIISQVDKDYFKELVCKRIIFDTTHRNIKKMNWYLGAYQMNIAEYAIAKYSYDLYRAGLQCNFSEIWNAQSIGPEMLGHLMRAAKQASDVINDPSRPVTNCSEWAKHTECWEQLKTFPSCLTPDTANPNPTHPKPIEPEKKDDPLGPSHQTPHRQRQSTITQQTAPVTAPLHRQSQSLATTESQEKVIALSSSSSTVQSESWSVDDKRSYLQKIPSQNWNIFMRWRERNSNNTQQDLAALGKLERSVELTDAEVELLWDLRSKAIRRGFAASILSPRK